MFLVLRYSKLDVGKLWYTLFLSFKKIEPVPKKEYSEFLEEAKKFLDFLFEADNMVKYSEFIKSPSAFEDVSADWGPIKDEVAHALATGIHIGFTNENPSGFSGDDAGRMVQELYAGEYKTSIDFAAAYKEIWDKAWNASNN